MDIERLATTAIIERLSFCEGISPFINDGDKEPSWDGHIYIYPNNKKSKSELIARVPVQIKGQSKTVKPSTTSINFSADVSDLVNYSTEGGVIYFVALISKDRSKQIFYKKLLPFDLQGILNVAKKNSKKSISLQRLPNTDNAIKQIFLSFIADRKRQATQIIWSEEQVNIAVREGAALSFHIHPIGDVENQGEIMRETSMQSFYLYVQTKEGVEFPFAKVEDNSYVVVKHEFKESVFVNDVKYFDYFNHGYENGNAYIYIGDVLKLPILKDGKITHSQNFTYTFKGTLANRIINSDFLLALSQHKKIRIGKIVTHEVDIKLEHDLKLSDFNTYLKSIKTTLDYFGVKADLNMDKLTKEDFHNIDILIYAAKGEKIQFKDKKLSAFFFYNEKIGNIIIHIRAEKVESEDYYRLYNAFADRTSFKLDFLDKNGDRVIIDPWSLFLHMNPNDFFCSNIDYGVILNSIQSMKKNDLNFTFHISKTKSIGVNNMLLNAIKAYDLQLTKEKQLLQFGIDVANILLDNTPESTINLLQLIKRQRSFTNDEISSLVVLRNKENQTNIIKCAISILLGETEIAWRLLNEMSETDRMQIVDYPIYTLLEEKQVHS